MRIAEDYLRLRNAFSEVAEGESFHVSMGDLAEIWYCTPRNAKLIVTKMIELEWIRFVSGRGRGNTSELTLLLPFDQLLLHTAEDLVKQGNVPGAFDWLKTYEGAAEVRTQFLQWLTGYFGYSTENRNGDRTMETLRLPIYREIVTLDPASAMFSLDTHIISQICSRLVEYEPETGAIRPGVAHHWETNEDGTEWTFFLHKGFWFHNGREVTAEEVKSSLLRLREPSCSHRWLVNDIARIDVDGRYKVKITLCKPNRRFLWFMSHTAASIVLGENSFDLKAKYVPVGSGPYHIVEFHSGKCVLEVFPSYHGQRGMMDRIEIIIVPANEAEACFGTSPGVLSVVTGEFHVPSTAMPQQETMTGVLMLTLNMKKEGWLRDWPLRKAIVHSIDRIRMIEELPEPWGYPVKGFSLKHEMEQKDLFYRPNEAMLALSDSGYDGQPLRLLTYGRHATAAAWLQQQYEAIGIRIEVSILPWSEMMEPSTIAQADLLLFEAVLSEGPLRLLEYFQSEGSFLRSSLSNEICENIDNRTFAMLADPEVVAEEKWLQETEEELTRASACVFLISKSVTTLFDSTLQDVKVNPKGWVDFSSIWYKPKK